MSFYFAYRVKLYERDDILAIVFFYILIFVLILILLVVLAS